MAKRKRLRFTPKQVAEIISRHMVQAQIVQNGTSVSFRYTSDGFEAEWEESDPSKPLILLPFSKKD